MARLERPLLGLIVAASAWSARGLLARVSWPNDLALHDAMVQWAAGRMERGHLPLDGWMPSLSGGLAQFHHYQSLPHVLTAIVGLAIGPQRALHLMLWLAVSTWPITVYLGARALGIDRRPALFAAACAPLLRSVTGYGFEPFSYLWLGNGLWSQAWGMWMAPLAIGWTVRTARTGERPVRAAIALALTISFHLPTAWFVLLALAAAPFLHPARLRDGLLRTARVIGAALLGCAWFLVPFLLDRGSENRTVFGRGGVFERSYGWSEVARWATSGDLLDHARLPVVSLLALAGALTAVRRWRVDAGSREVLGLATLSIILLCGTDPFGPLISLIPTSGDVFLHRAIAMVQLSALWLAGWGADGLAHLAERAVRRLRAQPRRLGARVGATLAVALLLVPAVRSTHRLYAEDRAWMADQHRADVRTGAEVGDLLALATAQGGGRVYAGPLSGPRTVMVGQVPGPIWLAHRNVDAMGFFLRVSALFADLEVLMDPTSASDLEAAGVRWVLQPASQPPVDEARFVAQRGPTQLWELPGRGMAFVADLRLPALDVASDRIAASVLASLRRDEGVAGVRALTFAGTDPPEGTVVGRVGPGAAGSVEGGRIDLADGAVDLDVRARRRAVVVVKANWDPRWHATVDGRAVRTVAVAPTWVAVPVPPGRHQVELRYESWPWTVPTLLVGWLGLVLVARGRGWRRSVRRGVRLPLAPREAHH